MSFLIASWRLATESCSVSLVGRTFLWRPQRYLYASFAPIFAKWAPHLSSTCSWCQQHKLFSWRYSSFFCKSQCWPPYLGFVCINPSSSTNEFNLSGTGIFIPETSVQWDPGGSPEQLCAGSRHEAVQFERADCFQWFWWVLKYWMHCIFSAVWTTYVYIILQKCDTFAGSSTNNCWKIWYVCVFCYTHTYVYICNDDPRMVRVETG